jgi:hypothetical protein
MLQRGDRVPHFDVEQMDGTRARYGELWQLRNLLLLSLPDDEMGSSSTMRRAWFGVRPSSVPRRPEWS